MSLKSRSGMCIRALEVLEFVARRRQTTSIELSHGLGIERVQALRWLYSLQEAFPAHVTTKKVQMDSHENTVHVIYFSFTPEWRKQHGWTK